MNRLELVVVPSPERRPEYHPVDIRIDGERLIDRLARIERASAIAEGHPELAGAYASLPVRSTCPPSRLLLGDPPPLLAHGGKTVLLICPCGCEGCWDFACRIEVGAGTVTWSDFEQVHRGWDYAALGTLVFSRAEYEAAIASCSPTAHPRT